MMDQENKDLLEKENKKADPDDCEEKELREERDSSEERDFREEILAIVRGDCSEEQIKEKLDEYHDNDIASVIPELTYEERAALLSAIGYEAMSHIVSYLEDAGEYLSDLDVSAAADIIEQMDAEISLIS